MSEASHGSLVAAPEATSEHSSEEMEGLEYENHTHEADEEEKVSNDEVRLKTEDENDEGEEKETYEENEDVKPVKMGGAKQDIWLRLFVAGHFVDSLLAGVKLVSDWLITDASAPLLLFHRTPEKNKKEYEEEDNDDDDMDGLADLRQQIAWHLAGLLNYLNPIVHRVESEIGDATLSQICELPQQGIPKLFWYFFP